MQDKKKIIIRTKPSGALSVGSIAARKNKKSEVAGVGCVVQLIGLIILSCGLPLGMGGLLFSVFLGLAVIILGGRMAYKYLCSHCGNRVQEKTARICASCGAHFTN